MHGGFLLGYKVYVDDGDSIFRLAGVVTDVSSTQFSVTELFLGRLYTWRVAAVSEVGEGINATLTELTGAVLAAPD
jgi:hypothetical protein